MDIISRLFRSNMVECPRCLGKGHVDEADIKRLKKELIWLPGKCAYCNGNGKVPPDRLEKVPADFAYLTTNRSSTERHRVIHGDVDAMKRAEGFDEKVRQLVAEIQHLYYVENMEPGQIAEHLIQINKVAGRARLEKDEVNMYVQKVLDVTRRKSSEE